MVKSILFQETAVADLLTATHRLFKNPTYPRKHIVFQSPTGSGKTVMLSQYIAQLFALESPDTEGCIVVLWMSIGANGLHIQSKKSLQRNLGSSVDVSLFDETYYGTQRTDITPQSVVVLNWESVYNKNKASSEWKNKIMKLGADRYNLPEIIAATRDLNRKLIVIVDESHIGSDAKRTDEIHEILKADVTILTSATPKHTPNKLEEKKNQAFHVLVDADEVVAAGMIKRDVLINADLAVYEAAAEAKGIKLTGDDLIMEAAFAQRQLLENAYPTEGVALRPLVLIQIPNSDAGNLRLDDIKNFLQTKGISEKDHADMVCFWYKNGDSGKTNFGIRYEEDTRVGTFYPDFVVGFHDRRIGIFDTKSGFTEKSSDTKAKAEYLQRYIVAENAKGNTLFGGIIAESKQAVLKLNSAAIYEPQDKDAGNWLPLTF